MSETRARGRDGAEPKLWYGPAGWHYDDWNGVVYPKPRPRGFHPLGYLAPCVNLVEVNATFYAPLAARTAARWVDLVAPWPDFRFVVKLWRRFTHEPELPVQGDADLWKEVLVPLVDAGRLLAVLVQFPFSVRDGPWARERLQRIRDFLPLCDLAVEFRHRSWLEPEAQELITDGGWSFVNIDQPVGRDAIPPTDLVTGPLAYVRLHGRNHAAWFAKDAGRDDRYDHLYTGEELVEWSERLRRIRAQGAPTVLVGNNHYEGKALVAVLSLAHALTGATAPVPDRLLESYPSLDRVHRPAPGRLF